jgi:hypothetical protein
MYYPITNIVSFECTTWGNVSVVGAAVYFERSTNDWVIRMPRLVGSGIRNAVGTHNYRVVCETLWLHGAFAVHKASL